MARARRLPPTFTSSTSERPLPFAAWPRGGRPAARRPPPRRCGACRRTRAPGFARPTTSRSAGVPRRSPAPPRRPPQPSSPPSSRRRRRRRRHPRLRPRPRRPRQRLALGALALALALGGLALFALGLEVGIGHAVLGGDHGLVGIDVGGDAGRERDVAHVQRVPDLEARDVDGEAGRDVVRLGGDEQRREDLVDHAVLPGDGLGLALEGDGHLDVDGLVQVDPDEVDVQDVAAHGVALHLLDQRRVVLPSMSRWITALRPCSVTRAARSSRQSTVRLIGSAPRPYTTPGTLPVARRRRTERVPSGARGLAWRVISAIGRLLPLRSRRSAGSVVDRTRLPAQAPRPPNPTPKRELVDIFGVGTPKDIDGLRGFSGCHTEVAPGLRGRKQPGTGAGGGTARRGRDPPARGSDG